MVYTLVVVQAIYNGLFHGRLYGFLDNNSLFLITLVLSQHPRCLFDLVVWDREQLIMWPGV